MHAFTLSHLYGQLQNYCTNSPKAVRYMYTVMVVLVQACLKRTVSTTLNLTLHCQKWTNTPNETFSRPCLLIFILILPSPGSQEDYSLLPLNLNCGNPHRAPWKCGDVKVCTELGERPFILHIRLCFSSLTQVLSYASSTARQLH